MHPPTPCTLTGRLVVLEPLAVEHAADLYASFAEDRTIWRWLPIAPPSTAQDMRTGIELCLKRQAAGEVVAFAQVRAATGRAVGVTNYLNIAVKDAGIEVGGTWLGASAHRTGINREAKLLLLRHAFETVGAARVQLKTDARNERSQRAIAAIGAVREGILRKHMMCWDGFLRDSVMFSVIDSEWPAVKTALEARVARG
jgi:RimJ/RimL family protein N-acetyltransferase